MELPASWQPVVGDELDKPYFEKLRRFLQEEREQHTIYPPEHDVFNALKLTPFEEARVLILGQDPYVNKGQAMGLAFSVPPGVRTPPSLVNIFKELRDDLGCKVPNNGCLVPWAEQGVVLLNAVLTVRAGQPNSHKGKGWEKFTDAVIHQLGTKEDEVVFVFWGANARRKVKLVDTERHTIIESAHPSPLSAGNGFFGSRPFSKVNRALKAAGKPAIDWQIPDV
jgi:uracil-DNA glycosylase